MDADGRTGDHLAVAMKCRGVAETVTVRPPARHRVDAHIGGDDAERADGGDLPILGRKFEDLLTLTPGVSIVQGPDGDEITFAGQRGIFNNISLDGGDYNNGFFGEQAGGQRAAIDITLDAVKEFQVIATGAPAEFGRTAGGVVNVITKSGTNTTARQRVPFPAARGSDRRALGRQQAGWIPPRAVRRHDSAGRSRRTRPSSSARSRASPATSRGPNLGRQLGDTRVPRRRIRPCSSTRR